MVVEIVDDIPVIRDETAFGWGENEISTKAWGWYITYILQTCCPDHVNIFQDEYPLYSYRAVLTLESLGFISGTGTGTYEINTSGKMGTYPLNPARDLVVISSVQTLDFYAAFQANKDYFYDSVAAGGKLLWCCADYSGSELSMIPVTFPLEVKYLRNLQNYNKIPDNTLPIVTGLTSPFFGTYASHGYFANLPPDAIVYIVDNDDEPTLIEYNYGLGKVMMTGITIEWEFGDATHHQILPRVYEHLTCKSMPEMDMMNESRVAPDYSKDSSVPVEK